MMPRPSSETMENGFPSSSFGHQRSRSQPSFHTNTGFGSSNDNDLRSQAAARFGMGTAQQQQQQQAPLTPMTEHPTTGGMMGQSMGGFRHDMASASPNMNNMNSMGGFGGGFSDVSPSTIAAQRMQQLGGGGSSLYHGQLGSSSATPRNTSSPNFPGEMGNTSEGPRGGAGLQQHNSPLPPGANHPLGVPGGAMGPGGPMSQAEREEELLLNLLIARRQRGRMSGEHSGDKSCGAVTGGGPQGLAEELMRMRQQQQQHQQQTRSPSGASQGSVGGLGSGSMMGGGGMGGGPSGRGGFPANSAMGHLPPVPGMPPLFSETAGASLPSHPVSHHHHPMNAGILPQTSYDNYSRKSDSISLSTTAAPPPHMQEMAERIDRSPTRLIDARSQDMMNNFPGGGGGRGLKRGMMGMGMGGMGAGGPFHTFEGANLKFQASLEMQGMNIPAVKKKRTHKKKPADMPRRPLSAYNLFFSEERERILKEIDAKEGGGSANAAAEDKDEDASESGGVPDEAEPKKAQEGGGEDDEDDAAKPKALLRPLIPSQKKRRPHRKTHGKISFQELARMVGERWKGLPDERRKYYQNLAREDMKRQKAAMEEYYAKQNTASPTKSPSEAAVPSTVTATTATDTTSASSESATAMQVETQSQQQQQQQPQPESINNMVKAESL